MLNKTKVEEVLVQNWTKFIDTNRLLATTLRDVRDHDLPVKVGKPPTKHSVQISVSRLQPGPHGFLLWVEFSIPRNEELALGTCEYALSWDGDLALRTVLGTRIIPPTDQAEAVETSQSAV